MYGILVCVFQIQGLGLSRPCIGKQYQFWSSLEQPTIVGKMQIGLDFLAKNTLVNSVVCGYRDI